MYTLPISPKYVSHWGLWQAVRELIQNAYDQRDSDPACRVEVRLNSRGTLRISTSTGELSASSLLLGETNKAGTTARGKFGEGYKLAMLVLTRLGLKVEIYNNSRKWIPRLQADPRFGCDLLVVYEEELPLAEPGVAFLVHGVTDDQWSEIQRNIRQDGGREDAILEDPSEKGRVYVGGLYVCSDTNFRFGYSLRAGSVQLDRDRGMIDGFNLSVQTSKLWSENKDDPRVYDLIKDEAPDVRYVQHVNSDSSAPVVAAVAARFVAEHGADTIPVSTQAEVQRAQEAGVRWVLVPSQLKDLIGRVQSIFIPSTDGPLARLQKFVEQHRWSLTVDQKIELDDIILVMSEQQSSMRAVAEEVGA